MLTIVGYLKEQYGSVQDSRRVLFNYCQTVAPPDFIHENNSVGRGGSIRNLLVHIANVYEFWVANNALHKNISYTGYHSKKNMADIAALFTQVDMYMNEFISLFQQVGEVRIDYRLDGVPDSAGGLKLFTHLITHEFHHKGQILAISRHLGYIPADTDIIR